MGTTFLSRRCKNSIGENKSRNQTVKSLKSHNQFDEFFFDMSKDMVEQGHDLLLEGSEEPTTADSVIKLIKRFCLKSIGWVAIYFVGYYNFSIAWLFTPLLLAVLRAQWKKERDAKLSAAREAALANEKTMILSRIRVEDFPSWVFFPDMERAEWINSIMKQ